MKQFHCIIYFQDGVIEIKSVATFQDDTTETDIRFETIMRVFNPSLEKLIEETETHVIIFILFFLFNLGGCGGSSIGGGSSNGGSGGELAWVGQELLELLGLLEGDLRDGGHGQEVLHTVGDAVRSAGYGWVSNLETDGGNVPNSAHEHVLDVVVGDVKDLGAEHGAGVVDLLDDEAVGEGRDLQHVEEGGLGGSDLVLLLDDVHILDNLNCTLGNLGWDGQSLEEGSLLRAHTSVLSWNCDINRSNGTGLGWSSLLVGPH